MYSLGDDNELDRLSKEAAGRYEVPGKANWQAMQAELDKVLPEEKKPQRKFFFFWWLLPALLLGGTAWWYLQKKGERPTTEKNIVPIANHRTNNTKQAEKQVSTDDPVMGVPKKSTVTQPATLRAEMDKQASVSISNLSAKRLPGEKTGTRIPTPIISTLSIKRVEKNEVKQQSAYPSNQLTVSPVTLIPGDAKMVDKATLPASKNNASESKETFVKMGADKLIASNPPIVKELSETVSPPVDGPSIQTADISKKPVTVASRRKWSYSFLAGVDESTVKFTYANHPGINIGVIAGYHFNNKWSLHTGAIYTQKNYKLAGADFTAPKGTWVSYYKLENVEGYCRMWEVPLSVRYTVSNRDRKSAFISTGLSSYFMTKEDYTYFYYSNGLPISKSASYASTDTHILSIAHLSAGFEKKISNTMSLIIEPYAKIPLAGVGFGNIKLSSFGLNFALQLRQLSKK